MSCLNPHDPNSMRIFTVDGAFHTLNAGTGGGMMRHGVLQPIPAFSPFRARCYVCNTREEYRLNDGTGCLAAALAAEPGTHQSNIILHAKGGAS